MVDGVLGQARAGASGVLLVAGEPGVGKSALLEYAAESASASGFQVVSASGAESEMELAFAGLQQLCAPLLDGLAQLPGPQRSAIETAFGVSAGVPPDPFFVGLGVLGLLAVAAAAGPRLWLCGDVQGLGLAAARARGGAAGRRRGGSAPRAAADAGGGAAVLWRACALAGIDPAAAGPGQDAGLVQVGTRVRFFHPLVRSAVFGAASAQERRAAHGVLAAATDAAADPGRRAWHRAQAAPGPDDQVAGELEAAAERARARGGVAAAAAFLERAAALTRDPRRRSARALAAAQAWHQAGGHDRAVELLEIAEAGPLGGLGRAQAERLRAHIIFVRTDGRDGTAQLLRAPTR